MSKPIRIQLSRKKGWRKPENTVVVARPSNFGNPFKVGRDGDTAKCVAKFRRLVADAISFPTEEDIRRDMRGKNLACWCPVFRCKCGESVDLPDNFGWKQTENTCPVCRAIINRTPCHADVLLEIANA